MFILANQPPTRQEVDALYAADAPYEVLIDALRERGENKEADDLELENRIRLSSYESRLRIVERLLDCPGCLSGSPVNPDEPCPLGYYNLPKGEHLKKLLEWGLRNRKFIHKKKESASFVLDSKRRTDRAARRAALRAAEFATEGDSMRQRIDRVVNGTPNITSTPYRRHKTRVVDINAVVRRAREDAESRGRMVVRTAHGGDVANKYGYPALTEAVLVMADPRGRATVLYRRITANKVTAAGVAANCLPEARPLFDGRCNETSREKAYQACKKAHIMLASAGRVWSE